MGCESSKQARFELNADHRAEIGRIAQWTLHNSETFKMNAALVAPYLKTTSSAFLKDSNPVRTFFRGSELPPQLGDGTRSILQLVTQMKLAAADQCKAVLMPVELQKHPELAKDARARLQVENVIASESDRAMTSVAEQHVEGLLSGHGAVHRSNSPAPVIPQRVLSSEQHPQPDGAIRQPRTSSMRPGEHANDDNEQVILPNGNWDKAENSDFYWSEDEKLFFHPKSGQFYDPATGKWYDPDNDEWYDEE